MQKTKKERKFLDQQKLFVVAVSSYKKCNKQVPKVSKLLVIWIYLLLTKVFS